MLLGETLGRYRVVEPLGAGGMAALYVGEHMVLGHRVAIKILPPQHLISPWAERRFLREARAMATIRHPGIVELFDIGRTKSGRAYIVMELLSGENLADRIARGGLSQPSALLFSRQMASALDAAHATNILHRDLKPHNAFVVADPDVDGGERIKIIDFGIAKRTADATPTPALTKSGIILGTPQYMSPEQCDGRIELDARSDIYSLGVLMFQMAPASYPSGTPARRRRSPITCSCSRGRRPRSTRHSHRPLRASSRAA